MLKYYRITIILFFMGGLEGYKGPEQNKQIEQKETSLEQKLAFLSEASGNKQDYKNFIKFLETKKGLKEYNSIIKKLQSEENTEDILGYIQENGFPIGKKFNEFVKDFFDIDIDEEVQKEKQKVQKEKQKVQKEKQKVKKGREEVKKGREEVKKEKQILLKRVNKFLGNGVREKLLNIEEGREFIKLLEKGDGIKAEEFLKQNGQELFKQIAHSSNLSIEERKELFETTKSFVSSNFPDIKVYDFEFYTGNWEKSPNPSKILEDVEGNLSNDMVSLDLENIPPKYDLGRIDSDYKFENKLDSKKVSDLTGEYLDEVKKYQEAGKNLEKLGKGYGNFKQNIRKLWQENIEDIQKGNYSEFKEGLQAYLNSFRLQNIRDLENSYDNLKIPDNLKITSQDINEIGYIDNPNDLQQKFKNFEEKYKKLQNYINTLPQRTYEEYKNKLENKVLEDTKENKEKQRKILDFLHKIGFDLLPQSLTDSLITNINASPKTYGFDTKIDLKNGIFGFVNSESKSDIPQIQKFTKMFKKMIGLEENDKLINTKNIGTTNSIMDPSKLNPYLYKKGYKGVGALNKMKENLKNSKNEENKEYIKKV